MIGQGNNDGKWLDKERKELLKTYMSYGLSKPFAIAIVEGANPEPILEFWEKDWHKQYEGVKAVLDQTITPEEGEWLNSVRSNHEDLIQLCLDGSCTIEWAKSLMEAGFLNHSREVSDILKGADPIVIGKLSGIELQFDLLPPKLEMKTKNTDPISRAVYGSTRKGIIQRRIGKSGEGLNE